MSNLLVSNSVMSQKPELSVWIVVCDSYVTKPIPGIDVIYSEFRGSDIKQVPILRIFGAAPDGHKVCLHVHGVFPYFYLPCPTSNPEPQFLYQIAAGLDKALNIALKQATSSNQHVYKISLVKGLPFYGFHDKDHLYLKVFLYNPGLIKQAVELCSNGAILGQAFQPHESHLNFTLQFFIDFNLFGMSNIDLQSVKFRKSGISQNSNDPLESPDVGLKTESNCHYEVDCMASHIMNRQRIGKGDGIENPGLEEVWNQEMERRKQLNVSMSKSLTQGRLDSNKETDSHYRFQQMFLNKLSSLSDKPVELKSEGVHYPAESLEGSQLFNAIDISMHLPERTFDSFNESVKQDYMDETLIDQDETLVDENVALNSSLSLHYSQVQMEKDDFDLVDMLQDMDDKNVEEDSILMTPAYDERLEEVDRDDAEYSQIFNDETLLDPGTSNNETELSWNDSFWGTANIPQLDGTCDDDHVKKVRKRKMRSFKLGLSKPKKDKSVVVKEEPVSEMDISVCDEINQSRETIADISEVYLKQSIKADLDSTQSELETNSITDLVYKNEILSQKQAKMYDIKNNFVPVAGPSNSVNQYESPIDNQIIANCNDTSESSPEDIGIMSFYNMSKVFDTSVDTKPTELLNKSDIHSGLQNIKHDITSKEINSIVLTPLIRPPSKADIVNTLTKYKIPIVRNPEPYYSNPKDVGDKVEIGQILLKLRSKCAQDQKPYERVIDSTSIEEWRQLLFLQSNELTENSSKPEALKKLLAGNRQCILEPVQRPPTRKEVVQWLKDTKKCDKDTSVTAAEISTRVDDLDNSQAIGLNDDEINNSVSLESNENEVKDSMLQITMQGNGSFLCFGSNNTVNENSIDTAAVEVDFLTLMVIEVHASSRGDLHPDPIIDPIQAVFITITNDCPNNHVLMKSHTEIIIADPLPSPKYLDRCIFKTDVQYVNTENEILEKIIELVKKHDPDIMCGYEIEMNSWGYILERAQILGFEMVREISRITEKHRQKKWRTEQNDFEGKIIGRISFNVWRLFRHELALSSYSFENCIYVILKERVPKFSPAELTRWWEDESRMLRWIPVEYYLTRLSGTVRMLDKLDIINRTSELARLFGLQWWEVLSRGSQFRVESLMLRAARPLNLIALSPTVRQRAAMRAPECLPLIFEPESRFYSDPVIVLDFQSLYPSMMIAYNYCFSTCIGRAQNINCDTNYEFGAWRLRIPKSKLETLVQNDLVHWSPVGVGFVKSSVRRGVLPALLRRILAARQAVKKGMKLQTDEAVKKAMHSRQLGLKLIANVTYGYTAANFSGRMPCVEVADSVVAKGRETLQRAIDLVMKNTEWGAKVIYGDTDSMFVLVPGRSRDEAFHIGRQIADAVTQSNPEPVALKLEKVYQPCILQTKKRYVGYMYETPDQELPVYEAKGIETVRRDGCPAGVKLLQNSLCELFSTGDMSRVKRIVLACLSRVSDGTMPAQELMFTREYHGANGYRPGASAPPNEIAKRISRRDRRGAPRPGQRVAWLVAAGAPGAPLVTLARTPLELMRTDRAPLVAYYVTRVLLPPLHRCLSLLGVDAPLVTLARTPLELMRTDRAPLVAYYVTRVLLPPLHRCLSLLGVDVFKWWSELGHSRECLPSRAAHGGIARYLWRDRCVISALTPFLRLSWSELGHSRECLPSRAPHGGIARYLWRDRCVICGARGVRAICNSCARGQKAVLMIATRASGRQTDKNNCDKICESCCGHRKFDACENTECPILWRRLTAQQNIDQLKDVVANLPLQFTTEKIDF